MSEKDNEVIAKLKRLLSLAKSNLERNEVQLKQKDQQLLELREALEVSQKASSSRTGRGIDEEYTPKVLLRRVDLDDRIWILAEYRESGMDDRWLSFHNEEALHDYIARIPGAPLIIPTSSLTPLLR